MRRFVSRVLPVVLFLVLLLSLGALAAPKVITILNTSDFHGNLLEGQKDKSNPPRPWGGEAIVAAYLNQYRLLSPGTTLVLDEGDIMQGPAVSTVFRGQSSIEAYNVTGYDAAALGNHEFDWGLDVLKVRVSEAKFPFLSANVVLKATGQRPEWVKPYAIFERGGVRIGVIGLLTMEAPAIIHPNVVGALDFRDATAVANELIPEVRAKGAQIVILLAHLGGDFDKQGVLTGEIASLAQNVKGADLILGGHTHTSLVAKVNGVSVVLPSYQGRAIGVTRITFDPDANKVLSVDPFLAPTFGDQIIADAKVQAVVDKYNKDLAPVMAEVLAQAPQGIVRDYENESALGDLVADVMRRTAKADLAFTNSGGLRTDIPAGPITLGKVWEVIPFDNTIVTMKLTGAQVLGLLANRSKGMAQTSGVKFTWRDIPGSKDKREIVSASLADGRPIDPEATYLVCTNDFMAGGGDNFTAFKSGTSVVNTQILLRDALINYLKAEGAAGRAVVPVVEGRAVKVQ